MSKRFFYALPKKERALMPGEIDRPWAHYIAPFRMAPHVWSVGGNDDVCVYLLDTGDGLILIDTGMEQYMYLLIDSIWRAGFDPRDIKKILLTHWHGDHTNGVRMLKEISNAQVYLSAADEGEYHLHAEDTFPWRTLPYTVDVNYDDSKPITLGRFTIRTKLVPGHSRGATAFFFDDTDETTGETFHIAMHGGLGASTMQKKLMDEDGLPYELSYQFVKDCEEISQFPVDIMLPSHMNQNNLEPNIPEGRKDYHVFVDRTCWKEILLERASLVKSFYPEVYGEVESSGLISSVPDYPEQNKK